MKVAILDTGADINHRSIKDNIVDCYNAINKSRDVFDICGHGTHIASIIASLAPDCELMIIKVLDDKGGGQIPYINEGIGYALQYGADIINASLGTNIYDECMHTLVKVCNSKGIKVIGAAAYYNGLSYPANFPESVSVGVCGPSGGICDFNTHSEYIDMYAPGVDIVGARANTDKYDKVLTGTSQSCAHITGLIASRH